MKTLKQLNSDESYIEVGRQSAHARNQQDEACAQFHAEHFHRMKAMEPEELKGHVEQLYRESYSLNRHVGRH
jgi:hypothetical protein